MLLVFLSGCSFYPHKMRANRVEEIAKEAINQGIYLTSEKPEKTKDYSGITYVYSFEDERGIPFHVKVCSPFFSLFEFVPGLYEDYVLFYTDYRDAIMEYYRNDVMRILDSAEGIEFDSKDKEIINIKDEEALDNLETILLQIDNLYAFDYKYCGELVKMNRKTYWHDNARFFDHLIRYNRNQEAVFYSDGRYDKLTQEDIQNIINELGK